jgi:hypothetical protein
MRVHVPRDRINARFDTQLSLPPLPLSLFLSRYTATDRLSAGQKFRRVSERMLTAKRERAALRARLLIPG